MTINPEVNEFFRCRLKILALENYDHGHIVKGSSWYEVQLYAIAQNNAIGNHTIAMHLRLIETF